MSHTHTTTRPRGRRAAIGVLAAATMSLGSLVAAAMGRPAADYADVRGAAWLLRPDPDGAEPSAGWDPDARDELLRAWKRYLPALAAGLVLDARARGLPAPTATELQAHLRTATLSGLPLSEVVR